MDSERNSKDMFRRGDYQVIAVSIKKDELILFIGESIFFSPI